MSQKGFAVSRIPHLHQEVRETNLFKLEQNRSQEDLGAFFGSFSASRNGSVTVFVPNLTMTKSASLHTTTAL